MSEILTGVTFPGQSITADDDGSLYRSCITDGILNGCAIGVNSARTAITIDSGRLVACGKEILINETKTLPITAQANSITHVRMKLVIDMTRSTGQQVYLDLDYSAGADNFPALTKQNLYITGRTLYEVALAIYPMSGSTISTSSGNYTYRIKRARGRAEVDTATIPASGWNSSTHENTVWKQYCYPSDNIICTYAPASHDAWIEAGIYLKEITAGNLKFCCENIPSVDLTANLMWL